MEEWRDIPGYEGYYQVSNIGRIKSLDRWIKRSDGKMHFERSRIMALSKSSNGYLQVNLRKNGTFKRFNVHRLVALAFIPNPYNLPQVNHKDENKQNNCVENLEWCTVKYNMEYSDVIKKGVEAAKIKQTWKKAQRLGAEITRKPVEVYKDGELIGIFESQSEAARQLNLTLQGISQVLRGVYNKHKGYTFKYHTS